jgi:short-subunit dehydrogenase
MDLKGRTAFITGASAGIGKAFTLDLAARGADLIVTARRADRLHELAREIERSHGVRVTALPDDLADPAAPSRLARAVDERGLAVDILVNNAGYGIPGTFASVEWRVHADFIQVLVTSLVHLTHEFLPGMRDRGYGRVINVASLAGLVPGTAGHTLYSAAKSFVIKFSESLSLESGKKGVHVTAVCPGFTYSEFHDVSGTRSLVSKLPGFMWKSAEAVAREGLEACDRGDSVYVNGAVNRLIAGANKLLPHPAAMALIARGSKVTRRQA